MDFIDLKSQYKILSKNINFRINKVLEHGQYILGPEVNELEEQLQHYVGVEHCVTCANGTDALQLALMAMGIGIGDAVLVPTFTFFASAESITLAGALPIFVDSDEHTFNMCPNSLQEQIDKIRASNLVNLKAIMTVNLFGLPANYNEIIPIAKKYNLKIIEDGAQGFGSEINGKKACSFGDISTTSFFPAKPLGCYGDGGAIFTNNKYFADLLRSLRVHGKGKNKYQNDRIGMNSRLDTIQAAILLAKLTVFNDELNARNKLAQLYNVKYENKYKTPMIPDGYKSSWAQYTVKSENRSEDILNLKLQGIPTMIYYPVCLHSQEAFKFLGYNTHDFPVATKLAKQVFSLPMHGYLKKL